MKGSAVETDHHSNDHVMRYFLFPFSPFSTTSLKLMILNFIHIFFTKIIGNTKYFYNFPL